MKYKFFGTPNMLVKTRHRVMFESTFDFKPLFRFDANGEYVTENENLIAKLKSRFDHTEIENSVADDKPENIEKEDKQEEKKSFKCKKCDFETDNQGSLMRHYKEHKKE